MVICENWENKEVAKRPTVGLMEFYAHGIPTVNKSSFTCSRKLRIMRPVDCGKCEPAFVLCLAGRA